MVKRGLQHAIYAGIMTAAAIVIVVLANLVISRLNLRWDITIGRSLSLSQQTEKILRDLRQDIKITAFLRGGRSSQLPVTGLLRELRQRSSRITLEFIDPDLHPELASRYNIKEYDVIVFESSKRFKSVYTRDMFIVDGYGNKPTLLRAEQAFINALLSIIDPDRLVVSFVSGHDERNPMSKDNEPEGYSIIRSYLENENYIINIINLVTENGVPSETSLLVIAGPRKVFNEREIGLLRYYLEHGGRAVFLLEPLVNTGLAKLLEEWKVELGKGLVIDKNSYYKEPTMPIPGYEEHPITHDLKEQRIASVLPGAMRVEAIEKRETSEEKAKTADLKIEQLLRTRPGSWEELNPQEKEPKCDNNDTVGPFPVALAVSDMSKQTIPAREIRMVIIGDSDFASNKIVQLQGNLDLFINSVNWVAGEQGKISIRPKELAGKQLNLSESRVRFIFYFTIILMPLLVLGAGLLVWWKRKP